MHVGFGAVVTAFDGIVEKTVDAIAAVLVVLGGIEFRPCAAMSARRDYPGSSRMASHCSRVHSSEAAADAPAKPVPAPQ